MGYFLFIKNIFCIPIQLFLCYASIYKVGHVLYCSHNSILFEVRLRNYIILNRKQLRLCESLEKYPNYALDRISLYIYSEHLFVLTESPHLM